MNNWQRILVFDSDVVEVSVVHTESPCPIFFLHQQDRGDKRIVAWLDYALLEHVFELCFNLVFLGW